MSSAATLADPAQAGAPRAFEAYGVEIEYAIVERASLDVAPLAADALAAGEEPRELAWSNELVEHALELKNTRPGPLAPLAQRFQAEVCAMNARLATLDARLMPGGMHPWMDPAAEARLWRHGGAEIYRAYDRIFGCRTHGWANVQSTQLNLPFCGEAEFARLHAAVRLIVPILPALAASSPFMDGRRAGALDARMEAYRGNAAAVPAINGSLVPDTARSRAEYEAAVLEPMYRAIAPHDREGVLRAEWLNARGAIPRFDRGAIEIRVVDVQECPAMDVAIAALAADLARALYREETAGLPAQRDIATAALSAVFVACVRDGERARIADPRYLRLLGVERAECDARSLWEALAARLAATGAPHLALWARPVEFIVSGGTLASRLVRAAGAEPGRARLRAVYAALCDCVASGERFPA